MSNELATIGPESTSYLTAFGAGDTESLKIYKLALVQLINATPQAPAGVFYDAQMDVKWDKMNIVPLNIRPGRSLMPPRDAGFENVRPICVSFDGKNPVVSASYIRQDGGRGCRYCPKGQWKEINGQRIRPECNQNFSFTFMEAETQFVYRLVAKGTNVTPVRELVERFERLDKLAKAKKQIFRPFSMTVEMGSVFIQKPGKKFYVLKFGPPVPIQDEDLLTEAETSFFKLQQLRNGGDEEEAEPVDAAIDSALNGEPPFDIAA